MREYGFSSVLFREPSIEDWQEASDCGFRWVELSLTHEYAETNGERILEDIRKAGLSLWTVHIPYGGKWDISCADEDTRRENVKRNLSIIERAASWGTHGVVIHPSGEPVYEAERSLRKSQSAHSIKVIAEAGDKYGIFTAVESLPRSCLGNYSKELAELINGTGAKVCFDVNHLLKESHEHFFTILSDKIATVHLSDYDGTDEGHFLPGNGIINWKLLCNEFFNAGYQGPMMFEINAIRTPNVRPENILAAFQKAVESEE